MHSQYIYIALAIFFNIQGAVNIWIKLQILAAHKYLTPDADLFVYMYAVLISAFCWSAAVCLCDSRKWGMPQVSGRTKSWFPSIHYLLMSHLNGIWNVQWKCAHAEEAAYQLWRKFPHPFHWSKLNFR